MYNFAQINKKTDKLEKQTYGKIDWAKTVVGRVFRTREWELVDQRVGRPECVKQRELVDQRVRVGRPEVCERSLEGRVWCMLNPLQAEAVHVFRNNVAQTMTLWFWLDMPDFSGEGPSMTGYIPSCRELFKVGYHSCPHQRPLLRIQPWPVVCRSGILDH